MDAGETLGFVPNGAGAVRGRRQGGGCSWVVKSRNRIGRVVVRKANVAANTVTGAFVSMTRGRSGSDGEDSGWDDAELNAALRAKVQELYGPASGRPDAVLKERADKARRDERERLAARSVIVNVVAVSVLSGFLFAALYYGGFVHGASNARPEYLAPTYGTDTYVDPVELLELESHSMTPFNAAPYQGQ